MQKNNQKRAALYLRASWDEMSSDDSAIATQEEKLKAYCATQNYITSEEHTYRDIALGTQSADERRGLRQLLDAAHKGEFSMVVVYKLDRFARNTRMFLKLFEELKQLDIGFQSATEAFNTSETSGRLLMQILASVAEAERETMCQRKLATCCNSSGCHCNC